MCFIASLGGGGGYSATYAVYTPAITFNILLIWPRWTLCMVKMEDANGYEEGGIGKKAKNDWRYVVKKTDYFSQILIYYFL